MRHPDTQSISHQSGTDRRSSIFPWKLIVSHAIAAGYLFLAMTSASQSHAQENQLTVFEKDVREWLQLRTELARENRQWQEEKAMLLEELRLLEDQKKRTETLLSLRQTDQQHTARELDALRVEKQQLENVQRSLSASLGKAEQDLASWKTKLPAALRTDFQSILQQKFIAAPDAKNGQDLSARLQSVLSLYSHLEELDKITHGKKMVISGPDGTEREMEVLFFGLGIGFALSADASLAGLCHPQKNGWVWEWHPEIAPQVKQAMECFRKERPAQFVLLPLKVGSTPK